MKFLVDAHLPKKLAVQLQDAGHEAKHTLDLEHANRTTDQVINAISIQEQRIVITKDADLWIRFSCKVNLGNCCCSPLATSEIKR